MVGVGDLNFESLVQPARGLPGGVKKDARVGAGARLDLGDKLEVLEVGAICGTAVKEVGAAAPCRTTTTRT